MMLNSEAVIKFSLNLSLVKVCLIISLFLNPLLIDIKVLILNAIRNQSPQGIDMYLLENPPVKKAIPYIMFCNTLDNLKQVLTKKIIPYHSGYNFLYCNLKLNMLLFNALDIW